MKYAAITFLEVEDVENYHLIGLKIGGGGSGVRDPGALNAAVMAPRSGYYVSLAHIAAAYAHGIALNHPFIDGNKRAGLDFRPVASWNSHGITLNLTTSTWETIMLNVATGTVTREDLAGAFRARDARTPST